MTMRRGSRLAKASHYSDIAVLPPLAMFSPRLQAKAANLQATASSASLFWLSGFLLDDVLLLPLYPFSYFARDHSEPRQPAAEIAAKVRSQV